MSTLTPSSKSLACFVLGSNLSISRNILLVLAGSILIALSAQIAIPFYPVPFTGQTFAVLMVGITLGSVRGALAVIAYLLEGLFGLPVFAQGGATATLFGPTLGYLLGFVPAAFIVGYLAERGWDRHPISTALAMLIGNGVIYIPGLIVLSTFLGKDLAATLSLGLVPFVLGDLIKLALATALMPLAWRLLNAKR